MAIKKYQASLNKYNNSETSWTSGVKDDNGNTTGSTTSHFTSNYTAVKANTKYSITGVYASGSSTAARIYYYDSSKAWISRTAAMRDNPLVFETPANCAYIQVQCANGADGSTFMLCEGEYTSETMPSYEPYGGTWNTVGYKKYETATDTYTSLPQTIIGDGQNISAYTIKGNMTQSGTPTPSNPIYPQEVGDLVTTGEHAGEYEIPISFNGVSYPIYLSEPLRKIGDYTDTINSDGTVTRNIGTVDLGTRTYNRTSSGNFYFSSSLSGMRIINNAQVGNGVCSEFSEVAPNVYASTPYAFCTCINSAATSCFNGTGFENYTVEQFKEAMDGVYMWYVLATPTTETFTAPSIPTSGTAQSFDIDTTLKPSEVSLTYHGWHEHSDTKFTT